MTRLRLAFLGTPDFALPCLEALAAAEHEIARVYCQPPRPAGRGNKPRPSPVQILAEARGWPVCHPTTLKDADEQEAFAALGLDVAVVVAYGLLLPRPILAEPRLGCLNLHASLLPRWRGAAPIHRAILAGDQETGVTIMQMDEGLDTGPILLREAVPIGPAATAVELHDRLAELGARMMVQVLNRLDRGTLTPRPQPVEGATYAAKLERSEGRLDWRRPAAELERQVRALNPWPGTFAEFPLKKGSERVKILTAEPSEAADGSPGEVIGEALTVACGEGALSLTRVQRAGRSAMSGPEFLRGFDLPPGTRLPLPEGAAP
jgi:methionyl-tRNA formyltransferase